MQIYDSLKNKETIMNKWLQGDSGKTKRTKITGNEEINNAIWEWFVSARAKGMPLSGPIIQAEAIEVAKKLGKSDFKASNGWLDSFKNRHNIQWNNVCGEAASVNVQTVKEWKEKILKIIEGYSPDTIYNGDETGLFYRMLPTKTLAQRGDKCIGGKMSKERLTVFICANMAGDIEKPIVIGKAAKPRCFKNLNRNSLPVIWKSNKKAWMTTQIMEEWLHEFNLKMVRENKNVLLFLDNATCHPHIKLSDVTLLWFPANTTAITQPMDQGAIYTFKSFYRSFVLQCLVSKIGNCKNVTELAKDINLLDCVYWVAKACELILPSTVKKCFNKAGFPCKEQLEENILEEPMNNIFKLCKRGHLDVDAELVVSFDNDLVTEEGINKAINFLDSDEEKMESEGDEGDSFSEESDMKIKTFADTLTAVSDLQQFAALKNCPQLLKVMQDAQNVLQTSVLHSATKQSTLLNTWAKKK